MGKKNIYMCTVNNRYGDNVFLPYSTGIIMSYCLSIDKIKENFEFKDNLFIKDDICKVVDKLENPAIFGFSSYIWNFEYNKKLAEQIKYKYPNCLIIFGGHQIPFESHDFFTNNSYVDIIIHGDGEIPFSEILLEYLSDKNFSNIDNLSINVGGKTFKTRIKKRNSDLSSIPSPYLTGIFDKIIKLPYSFVASLETNRGCPYGCTYCDWGSPFMYYKNIIPFDEQRVKDEIEWFGKNKIELVFGCDSNFGILPRDNKFISKFIDVKNRYGFPKKFRTTYAKNSNYTIFKMNKDLNKHKMCKGVTLSFQSLNYKTLDAIGRVNMQMEDFKKLIKLYNDEGISTYTEIIIGLPHETYDSFCDGLNTILENGQHGSINIYNCEIFPNSIMGTKVYQDIYGIKSVRIPALLPHSIPDLDSVQEYTEIVIGTNSMHIGDWKRAYIFSWTIQCFHCLGLTQYISIFFHNELEISYRQFYEDLISYGENNPKSIIGQELKFVSDIIDGVTKGGSLEFVIKRFGDITWYIEESSFLNIIYNKKNFYDELKNYLLSYIKNIDGDIISDLIKYSDQMVIDPFCKNIMELELIYDFHEYFKEYYRCIERPKLVQIKNKLTLFDIEEFNGNLPNYAKQIIWYGRKGGKFFHDQSKIIKQY